MTIIAIFGGAPLDVHVDSTVSHVAPPSLAGANGNIWSNYFELDNPLFIQAMQDLHITAYRFPGGTVANGYDTITGLMYPNLREPSWGIYNKRHPDGLTILDYVQLTNTFELPQQQYVINLLSTPNPDGSGDGVVTATIAQYQEEVDRIQPFLQSMVKNGFNPAFIEYTNEIYLPMYNKLGFDKTVENYEDRINTFSPMLRGLFPETPCAAVIPLSEKYRNKEGPDGDLGNLEYWEIDSTIDFQAIVLHAYVSGTYELKQYIEFDNNSLEDVMTNWMVQTELGLAAAMEYAQMMYPTKEVWMTEWGILISNIDGEVYEPILRNCTLVGMQAASMYIEMLKYSTITLANHHGMVPMLNPIYDENHVLLQFDRTTHGDIAAHMNGLLSRSPTVLATSISGAGEVVAPIVDPNGNGWGGFAASSISDVLVDIDSELHWLAINREALPQEVAIQVGEIGVTVGDIEVTRFYTTQLLEPPDPFAGTLDLFEPATIDIIEADIVDGVVTLTIPAMGFVDVHILPIAGDVNGDGLINVSDILAIIAVWECMGCPEDISGNGVVDVADILIVISNWG